MLLAGFLLPVLLRAPAPDSLLQNLSLSGYGVVNYYHFNWETLPDRNNAFDPERMNLYMYYDFTERIQLKTEVEFEHGGTGATMAFDPLEEFGEFEQEIEKGGEVVLEQINLHFQFSEKLQLRAGKMRFYMGNASKQDEPNEYFTGYRSEVENTVIPLGWYETGLELSGAFRYGSAAYPRFEYKAYVVSGLDNSGFSSANWIRRGYQTRFETINADDLALALRLDHVFNPDNEIGISAYTCNATGNRPKEDFTADSRVVYADVHYALVRPPFRATALVMGGYVQNSEALSEANRNLSNNLGVKRTPVGAAAAGAYAEAGFDVLHFRNKIPQCYVFARYDWYDTMFRTEGEVTDNPRYARTVYTAGINYLPIKNIAIKSHYALRMLGSGEQENTFLLGFGFEF